MTNNTKEIKQAKATSLCPEKTLNQLELLRMEAFNQILNQLLIQLQEGKTDGDNHLCIQENKHS